MTEETKIVTVQSLAPLVVALLRGLVFAVIGAISGIVSVLQTNADADVRKIIVGAIVGGGLAFAGRATEGLVDTNRAATVSGDTPIRDVVPGTNTTGGM